MKTHLAVLLDRSGSMSSQKSDHEGGLKSFVEDNKKLQGDVYFTLAQFDSANPFELLYDSTPISDVDDIELIPRGATPLLDAVGEMLTHIEKANKNNPVDDVLLMIITDGYENASQKWTKEAVKKAVDEKKQAGWQILFLGANLDNFADAASMNLDMNKVVRCSNIGNTYERLSSKFVTYNTNRAAGETVMQCSSSLDFSDDDVQYMNGAKNEAVSSNSGTSADSQAS